MNTPNWFTRMVAIRDVKPPLHPRTYKPEGIAALAESIYVLGLDHPILIDEDDNLLAGQRRLAACTSLGWTTIPAKVVKLEGASAELATLDENLCREDYIEAERLLALGRRKELYEAIHPETKGGVAGATARHTKGSANADSASAESFASDTAAKTGKAVSTVTHDQTIADRLDHKAASALIGTPSGDNKAELSALSKLPATEQRKVAAAVKSGKAESVRKAIPTPAPKNGQQLQDTRLWEDALGLLRKAVVKADLIHRDYPNRILHGAVLGQINMAVRSLKEWRGVNK